jgi:dipeptidase
MDAQLIAYLVFFLPLYHSFQTFQFTNILFFKEYVFVLKSQVALNELEPNSIDIMCSSIIDNHINHLNQYESFSIIKFNFLIKLKQKFKTSQTQNY